MSFTSPDTAPSAPRLLEHAIVRAAAWPIETTDYFAAPGLAASARAVLRSEAQVLEHRTAVLQALEAAMPGAPDRRARALLLRIRRGLFAGAGPVPGLQEAARLLRDVPEVAGLLVEEDALRATLVERLRSFERLHAEEWQRQRQVLWAVARTSRFLKALEIANPEVAARWDALDDLGAPASARGRRLEATVFHYLMRAAGRPTPQGAWAGVALVEPRDQGALLEVFPAEPGYDVTVNLVPFHIMLEQLAGTRRYRFDYLLSLNPTLHRTDQGWR
jgi:hypothetical protein